MFGPFTAKDGCKERKRYGALFTCLSSRAVHIEVMHDMTTDSFIMCLRRFIGHLGYVWMIRTDNGTNFVGASAEFIESFQEKKSFMAPFYRWGSTASRLQPLGGGSLLFTTQFPEIPGTHFVDLGRMKG